MKDLEKRIVAIEKRNRKVEQDKGWETSWTRRIALAMLTYAVVLVYLLVIDASRPFLTARVPVVGFLLSTLVLKRIRAIWQK